MADLIMSAAASSSMASSSASISCTPWDVFVNHRGPDGKMAAKYLYRCLISKGLRRVFLDKEEMEETQSISRQIREAIDGASLHIAIFSPRYAESSWCLDELVRMLDSGKPIFPVFFKVNPSVVRHNVKDGEYADALRDLAKKTTADPKTGEENRRHSDDTIHQWRAALSSVAGLSGIVIRDEDDELEQLDNVVEKVLKMDLKVPKPLLLVADYPTGLDLKVDEFENFEKVLSNQERCKVVGIVGAGGVGKTTLAKKLFNLRRSDYSKSSFLFDVRQKDITLSQTKLLEDFKAENNCKIDSSDEGSGKLTENFSSSSFHSLIVLDDIDDASQLRALLPMRDNLSRESLILVTSRDTHVFRSSGLLDCSIYYLKGLSESHSEELFCCYALNQRFPSPDFEGLVKRFVKSCDGLPLSLKVFGALVSGQEECYWEETLDELEKILPGTEIHKSLKISYDKLSSDDQEIFLDLASFFIGEKRDRAIRIWGLRGIVNLQDKCLFELDAENKIRIHDHFRDLARNIAQGLGIHRLWEQSAEDIDVLLEQSSWEMTEVRGIRMLYYYFWDGTAAGDGTYAVKPKAGRKRRRDGAVKPKAGRKRRRDGACGISNLQFVATGAGCDLERILEKERSPNLKWLRWYRCPCSCLPSWIPMENLRVLQIVGNRFKSLWEEESRAPLQLRELHIKTLASFSKFPKSIGQLQYLEKIRIIVSGSASLIVSGSASLKSLPEEFCELRSLKYLCLDGFREIISLPNSFGRLTNLQHIRLRHAISLQMLPESFGDLTRLKSLDLRGCDKLTLSSAMLGNITTLEFLKISYCANVTELPPQIEHQRSLKKLRMTGTNFKELPDWIGNLCNLEALSIGNDSLEVLPPLLLSNLRSLKKLSISWAPELEYLPNHFPPFCQLEKLQILCCGIEYLPQHLLKMNNLLLLKVEDCPLLELPFGKIEEERETGRELKSFHADGKCMLALKEIDLDRTEISEVFFPKCVCPNLQRLSLTECKKLTQIGGLCGLSKLEELYIRYCPGLTQIGGLCGLSKLKGLHIVWGVRLEELPNLESLISLERLEVSTCKRLRSIPGLGQLKKLRSLKVWGCDEMVELSGAKHLMLLKELDARLCPKLRWGEGEVEHLRQRLKAALYL